jgi:hypothetical protein
VIGKFLNITEIWQLRRREKAKAKIVGTNASMPLTNW